MKAWIVFASILLTCGTELVSAQSCSATIDSAVNSFKQSGTATLKNSLSFHLGAEKCLVALILTETDSKRKLEARIRAVKAALQQNGSSAGTAGSTNLVSKGATAEVLSAAVEYGALTESTSGQTVTLQGSLGGVPALLSQNSILPVCTNGDHSPCVNLKLINNLNRISYGIGFDTSTNSQSVNGTTTSSGSSSSAQPATFTASTHTLNSATAKIVLISAPAANGTAIANAIGKLTSTSNLSKMGTRLQAAANTFNADCPDGLGTALLGWQTAAFAALTAPLAPGQTIEAVWAAQGPGLIVALMGDGDKCSKNYLDDAIAYSSAFNNYLLAGNTFFQGLRATPLLTIEYDFNSPASQPTNSTIRLIGQINKSGFTGSLNAAGSFYNSTPSSSIPGASLVRDFQIAGEGSYGFGDKNGQTSNPFLGTSTASLAYYYQDQTSPAILNVTPGQPASGVTITGLPSTATQVYAQRGVINVAQGKFTWIPSNWNINFPVSVTWSNRTELVTSPVWRGQLGISYDFDSLFSK
jgi:hypothetical protein